jgi:long-subunit acyl-CoA synthetase (AMP-forming)
MFYSLFNQPANKVFLMHQHQQYSYGWLQKRILQLTGLFNSVSLKAGDRLLLAIADEVEFSAVFLAALANGIAIIPLDPDTKAPRATALVSRSRIACIIADEQSLQTWNLTDSESQRIIVKTKRESGNSGHLSRFLKKKITASPENNYYSLLENIEPASEFPVTPVSETLAYIIFTSGTTASSKGVCITHGNLFTHLGTLQKVYTLTEESSLLNQLMLWHADGCIQGPVLAAF